MEFEWDPKKAESNFEKHSVRFTEAESVCIDNNLFTMFDESSEEERYIAIGREYGGRILFVVYAVRGETIRPISARKATAKERVEYKKKMKLKYDFSKARRGPLVPKDPSKQPVTIRLDNHALDYLAEMVDRSGGGSLENVINTALRDLIALCERLPVAEREYFFERAARADFPQALEILARARARKPPRPGDRS